MKLPELTKEQLNEPFDPILFGLTIKRNNRRSCFEFYKGEKRICAYTEVSNYRHEINTNTGLWASTTNGRIIRGIENELNK